MLVIQKPPDSQEKRLRHFLRLLGYLIAMLLLGVVLIVLAARNNYGWLWWGPSYVLWAWLVWAIRSENRT